MTVVFDAEPFVAFAFDEPRAEAVEDILDDVYDGETDGYVTTIMDFVESRLRFYMTREPGF